MERAKAGDRIYQFGDGTDPRSGGFGSLQSFDGRTGQVKMDVSDCIVEVSLDDCVAEQQARTSASANGFLLIFASNRF